MDDKEKTLQQLIDELEQETKPYSKSLARLEQYPIYQEYIEAGNQPKQSKKTKRRSKIQQWAIPPENDDIVLSKKKKVTAINIAVVCDEHTGLLKCQPEERRIEVPFTPPPANEVLNPRKHNLNKHVFHSSYHVNEKVFSICDDKRDELLKLLDAIGIHSPNNASCLCWIEVLTRHFICDWIEEQKQPGADKKNAPKQAQHEWISNVRNTLADYRFNGAVKQMITIFRKLIQCFDKKLSISIGDAVLRRALIKQPKSKT